MQARSQRREQREERARRGWRGRARGGAAIVAALWGLGAVPAGAAAEEHVPVLAVSGEGEVSRPPDLALLQLGVEAQDAQASEAQERVSAVANAIFAALGERGVESRDLQTAELQIGPVYAPRSRGEEDAPRIVGYRASNQVRVRVRDLDALGALVDAGLAAGANRVDGIAFTLEEDREARAEALRLAVLDARAKSRAMAEALEVELGPVRSLREGFVASPRSAPPMVRSMAQAETASTPTAPGELQIRAQVQLEYELR